MQGCGKKSSCSCPSKFRSSIVSRGTSSWNTRVADRRWSKSRNTNSKKRISRSSRRRTRPGSERRMCHRRRRTRRRRALPPGRPRRRPHRVAAAVRPPRGAHRGMKSNSGAFCFSWIVLIFAQYLSQLANSNRRVFLFNCPQICENCKPGWDVFLFISSSSSSRDSLSSSLFEFRFVFCSLSVFLLLKRP